MAIKVGVVGCLGILGIKNKKIWCLYIVLIFSLLIKKIKKYFQNKTIIYVSHKKHDKYFDKVYKFNQNFIETNLIYQERNSLPKPDFTQLSIFDKLEPTKEDKIKCLTGNL